MGCRWSNGVGSSTSGFPARSPAPSLSIGTLHKTDPVPPPSSFHARRLPSGVKDHGYWRFLLWVNGWRPRPGRRYGSPSSRRGSSHTRPEPWGFPLPAAGAATSPGGKPTFFLWYEWTPPGWVQIDNLPVNSGDLITVVICTSGAGGIVPLLDTFIGADSGNPLDRVTASLESDRYYRWCVYLFVPLQFASLRERRRCLLP